VIVLNSLLMACECFFGGSLLLALALVLSRGKPASQSHLILTGAFGVVAAAVASGLDFGAATRDGAVRAAANDDDSRTRCAAPL
jgi:drug/metabolite transporter (DMT)-like permease